MNPQRAEDSELKVAVGQSGYEYSLNGELFTGVSYRLRSEGQLWYETEYLNGYQQVEREWYLSGQLKSENVHREGTIYGSWREWFENGQLKQEELREHGVVVKETIWDEAGHVVCEHEINERDRDFPRLQRLRAGYAWWLAQQDKHVNDLTGGADS